MEELYERYYEPLLNRCLSLTGRRSEAEDLVQETFLRALSHMDVLMDLDPGQKRSWLYRTAKNCWIDRVRKTSREAELTEAVLDTALGEEDFTGGEVAALLARLPEEERDLFTLRYFSGYNAAELGELFGLPPGTVRSRLASARKRLKKWIEKDQ